MGAKYFNKHEFMKALSLINTNPVKAKLMYEEYIEKYPRDYSAYAYYASLLITLGELEEAEKMLDYVQSISIGNHHFNNDTNRREAFESNYVFTKIRLLSYKKDYTELYKLTSYSFKNRKDNVCLNAVRLFCKKNLEKLKLDRDNLGSYLFRQIFEYSESEFMEHISRHMADYNQNSDNPNKNIFVPDFPINDVLNEIKKYIPSNKRLLPGFIDNTYFFKYDECGRENNKMVNYFKVVCFHDTVDFITMLPISYCENLPYTDLNYLKKDDKPVVKRKSRIEMFNQKYNRN